MKEEYREVFKLVRRDIGNHKCHYAITPTEISKEIKDKNRHNVILKEGKEEQGGGERLIQTKHGRTGKSWYNNNRNDKSKYDNYTTNEMS